MDLFGKGMFSSFQIVLYTIFRDLNVHGRWGIGLGVLVARVSGFQAKGTGFNP